MKPVIAKQSITKRFILVFAFLVLIIFVVATCMAYRYQAKSYHETVVTNMRYICTQLKDEIKADAEEFGA